MPGMAWVRGTSKARGFGMHCKLSSSMARRPVPVIVWLNCVRSRRSPSAWLYGTACTMRGRSNRTVVSLHHTFVGGSDERG